MSTTAPVTPAVSACGLHSEESGSAYAAVHQFLERMVGLSKAHAMGRLAATELTFSQMKVLFALSGSERSMSLNAIADNVHLSLAAAGRTVDKLVGLALVDRREDSCDRRVKRVSLTESGTAFIDSQLTIRNEIVRRFVDGLPDTVRDDLHRALASVVDADIDYFNIDASGVDNLQEES